MTSSSLPWIVRLTPPKLREPLYWHILARRRPPKGDQPLEATLHYAPLVRLRLRGTDVAHRQLAATGLYEYAVTRGIVRLAAVGRLFIDVGANYGYYSCLWAAARAGNRAIAIEPSTDNANALRLNVERNGLSSMIEVHEIALADVAGSLPFDPGPPEQSGWGGLVLSEEMVNRAARVETDTLDHVIQQLPAATTVDVLKIDAEGADALILQGGGVSLAEHRIRHVFFEENPARMQALGVAAGSAGNLLRKYGYALSRLDAANWYGTCVHQ